MAVAGDKLGRAIVQTEQTDLPRVPPPRPPPRQSNTSTPGPNDDGSSLADRLNFADIPRPFKNPHFVSKLAQRTASSTTTQVRKNVKQIHILERERLSGGDGFLSASQTRQKLRGEPIDPAGKKKSTGTGNVKKKGNINNLRKGRLSNLAGGSGTVTPSTVMDGEDSVVDSRRTTPIDDDDEEGGGAGQNVAPNARGDGFDDISPKGEVITYHTPTAPPSLLPAKKYCDITGLHAAYTDPRTKLRYKGLDVWHVVRGLGPGSDQAYLSLRGAQTALK